ncbi:hypothetical protein CBP51_00020 [Cellvibrio mixtus]|uniref:Uncharacterized protein n=1 Tax=Cellvibrio mixtus TaxID=39650 RepID=A0A266Q6K0_9GAMM|nr:hypothetical protein [Cellvibrio mixtus]OZY85475.1 hypothetical protein CBP51_00020 [Cellvibrio mixtus]
MTIAIDIESANLETRNKKGGGTYQVQEAFAHTTDNHGNPRRYPERINIFPPKDAKVMSLPIHPAPIFWLRNLSRLITDFLSLVFLN